MQVYAAKYNAAQSYAAQMVWHEILGGIRMGSMPPHWHAMPSNAISSNSMPPKAIVDMALVACIPHHGRKPGVNGHGRQCHSTAANAIPLNNMQLYAAKYNAAQRYAAQMVWHEIPGGIRMGSMPPHWHMPCHSLT